MIVVLSGIRNGLRCRTHVGLDELLKNLTDESTDFVVPTPHVSALLSFNEPPRASRSRRSVSTGTPEVGAGRREILSEGLRPSTSGGVAGWNAYVVGMGRDTGSCGAQV
jgi:hypothetical protein